MGRSRLPPGYVGFRPDLGGFLKLRRKALFGKQQALADAIGIARPSLSAIEAGHVLPLPDTVEGLMRELSLTWQMILVPGRTDRPARFTDESLRGDRLLELGQSLREGRRREGLRLWQVARRCGMSKAQLSRIERGQLGSSRVYEDDPGDAALPPEDRGVRFRDPELHRLYALG